MFKRKLIKANKLKKILLKMLNLHALDKETFDIVNPQVNNSGQNFFKFNEKSYILSTIAITLVLLTLAVIILNT